MSFSSGIGSVLEALQQGTAVEREAALEELRARTATRPEDPHAVRDHAMALSEVGRIREAVELFRQLVKRYPDEPQFEADLAMAHLRFGNVALARHHLGRVVHGGSEETRTFAREQLAVLDRFELRGEDDRRLRAAQLAVLRERIAGATPSEADVTALGRKLFSDSIREQDSALRDEAVAALERARAASPESVPVLELLVLFYSSRDPEGRLHPTLQDLERLQPESPVFDALRKSQRFAGQYPLAGRAYELLGSMDSDDPAVREAVVHDLGSVVATSPENGSYRIAYALALMIDGQPQPAREQALIAAQYVDDDYADNFKLSQVFLGIGDLVLAGEHAQRAVALAGDDVEHQDAEALLARTRDA